jgi:hypothetical protein
MAANTAAMEDALYNFTAQKGQVTMADFQTLATESNLNLYDVNIAIKRLLSTGRIYYVRSGVMIANPKKGGAPTAVQPGIKTNQWEKVSHESWAGGSTPPGVGRIRLN